MSMSGLKIHNKEHNQRVKKSLREVFKMTYEVIKVNGDNGNEINYGTYTDLDDVKAITNGYTFNGLFYTRKNSKFFFIVNVK